MRNHLRNTRGFTLIELVVTVAIIGILTAIAIPSYFQYIQRAARSEARTALLSTRQMMERWYTTNNAYTTYNAVTNAAAPLNNFFPTTSGDNPASAYYNLTAVACTPAQATTVCVEIQAAPGGGRNWTDATCGTLAIDTAGNTYSNATGAARTTPAIVTCWQR